MNNIKMKKFNAYFIACLLILSITIAIASTTIENGYSGTYEITEYNLTPSDSMSLGQTFNGSKTTSLTATITDDATKSHPNDINTTGLVGWWKLDDDYLDSSGTGNNGTGYGTDIHYDHGKYDNGSVFNGIDDYVDCGNDASLDITDEITLSVWVYKSDYSIGDVYQAIISKSHTVYEVYLFNGKLTFQANRASTLKADYDVILSSGWHYVTFTFDKNNINSYGEYHSLYVDGEIKPLNWMTGVDTNASLNIDSTNLIIGSRGGSVLFFNGSIDNVLIYNRSLSTTEIQSLYLDKLEQFQVNTSANSAYSTMWNSSSDNPLSIPFADGDLFNALNFKVPDSIIQDGITIYDYPSTVQFDITANVDYTDDITKITESASNGKYTLNITQTAFNSGTGYINYTTTNSVLLGADSWNTATLNSDNPNASLSSILPNFNISTGYVAATSEYYYLVEQDYVYDNVLGFIDPTPANESTILVDHTTINVSITTSELTYFTFNWNGTNYTYTTAGTEWNQSTDSYERTTTVGTYTQPDFDNIYPWSHMRRCTLFDNGTVNYYLDATNSSLKATGELSDLSGTDGQVMVQIPKFYYSHTFANSIHDWEISRFNMSGFEVHNAFLKNGEEVDYRYIGAYEGSMWDATTSDMVSSSDITTNMYAAGDILCSVSGEYPKTYETRAEFRAMASERGTGWRQQDFDLISAVQLLYLIEYADFNSQTQIGYGRTQLSGGTWTADSYIGQCGKSNVDGDGTNSVAGNTNNAYMSYRGIENFYGNVWQLVDGININDNVPYVSNTDTDFADDTTVNYINLSVILPSADGIQVSLVDTDRGFLPASVGGSLSTYIPDYYYQNTAWRVFALGANVLHNEYTGMFGISVHKSSSSMGSDFGGRLAY